MTLAASVAFSRDTLDAVVADDQFVALPTDHPAFWRKIVEAFALRVLNDVYAEGDLRWRLIASPVVFQGSTIRPIDPADIDDVMSGGDDVGTIEWLHLRQFGSPWRLIVVLVSGRGVEDVRLYGTHAGAVSVFRGLLAGHRSAALH